jgi:hypothetical protein
MFIFLFNFINLITIVNAIDFKLINKCNYTLNLYTNENNQFNKLCDLESNQNNCQITYNNIPSGLIKHTLDADATLFEFTINDFGIWYDISVIPPGSGVCNSYDECRQKSISDSFNVPMDIIVKNDNELYSQSCVSLQCNYNQCPDAYLFPYDDLKTHFCPRGTNFDIIFCNNNETVINSVNETVIDPINETVIDSVNETVIDSVNETVIDSVNEPILFKPNNDFNERNTIFNINNEKQLVSVCKDASYLINGPICVGDGILPSGITCPVKGDKTKYDCQPSSINFNEGECIAQEDAKCMKHNGVWKCMYSSLGCDSDINDNLSNDKNNNDININNNNINDNNNNENSFNDGITNHSINFNNNSNSNSGSNDGSNNSEIIDFNHLYKLLPYDWKDLNNWEYSSGNPVKPEMFTNDQILLSSENSPEPIRTKTSWSGEKIIIIEWERSENSDTNIWMLNEKLRNQFEKNNGWPYWGELDIFEMFTEDKILQPQYDFTGFKDFTDVSSYGQLTLHMGPKHGDGDPCFCPASHTKELWYQNIPSMTSGCTAQFKNINKNKIAMVFSKDENGHYLQVIQFPIVNNIENDLYSITSNSDSILTSKIYNNDKLFWGMPAEAECAIKGGHNPDTGFPFFEEFYLTLEEQKKDPDSWFKINNIEIYIKN